MAKQAIGSSTDPWPPSRGGGLLPLPSQTQSTSAATAISSSHPHPPPPRAFQNNRGHQQQQQPLNRHRRSVAGGQQLGREDLMSPSGGKNSDRDHSRERGAAGGRHHTGGTQHVSQGTSGDITATAIVHQHDLETLDSCSRNPLLCLICNNAYEDPRLLSCYHSFCAKCLPGRWGDGKIVCPLCGKLTALKDASGPPPDHLLRYLLQSCPDTHPSCANCDNKSSDRKFYCNTCGQVLCNQCREETHRAKMFSSHDIIPVSKYTKDTLKKCSVHGEQFIMFSNVQKQMLCINCYRDTAMESRLHCVDLDTAYNQGCRKLERAVMSLRDLQLAVRDGITMLKSVLEELRRNSDSEKSALNAVCQTILDALTKTQENLMKDVEGQTEAKDKVIRGQLSQLRSVLPTIKLHLAMCASIGTTTNKYDFLDLAYPLIDRLTAITHMGYPIRPGQSSQIKSNYKSEIARTLEPWVAGPHRDVAPGVKPYPQIQKADYPPAAGTSALPDSALTEPIYAQYHPMSRSTVTPGVGPKPQATSGYAAPVAMDGVGPSGRKTPIPRPKVEGTDDHFSAHCKSFAAHVNELNQRLSRLKEQVQELHRDITLQRGSAHAIRAESALREGLFLEDQLERRHAEMDRIRKHLENQWSDNIRHIRMEQEVFQSQINEILAMKSEVKQISGLLQQLQSFLKSLGVHLPSHQQPGRNGPGGPGPGAGGGVGGGGGSSVSFGGSGLSVGKVGGPVRTSGHGLPPGQTGQAQQHAQHLTSIPDSFSRADSGSQVTPSLREMSYPEQIKGGFKSDTTRGSKGRVIVPSQQQIPTVVSHLMEGPLLKPQFQPGFAPRPSYQQKPSTQAEMDYIQVDTSYSQTGSQRGVADISEVSMKKGSMLSQLMEKVRAKDDRKKSSASGVSSSSSGGTIPQGQQQQTVPPPRPPQSASALPTRRTLAMYDAQCQYGLESATSAVSALALANANIKRAAESAGEISYNQRKESRPTYQRAKSFVKSKSDDERPPNKLSQQRARSAGQLETESLLRSLSTGSKDASRILELYQSLSKTIMERQNLRQQESYLLQQPSTSEYANQSAFASLIAGPIPSKSSDGTTFPPYGQSHSLGRLHSKSPSSVSRRSRPEESLTASEDDYQQIPFNHRTHPIARSHSAPPRKATPSDEPPSESSGAAGTQVKVFVHDEPISRTRSSTAPAPVSKSLEESYLCGYLSQRHSERQTSSSGHSGLGFTLGRKPASCESLISGTANVEGNSRKSSIDFDRRSVVTVRRAGSKPTLITPRQHSFETGISLSGRRHSMSTPQLSPTTDDPFGSGRSSSEGGDLAHEGRSGMYDDDDFATNPLHKADSFEGHEEAVRSIVAAVQETRTLQRKLQSN